MDNTKLAYLGMQDQYYTFSMFDAQAWYVRDVITGENRAAVARRYGEGRGRVAGARRRRSRIRYEDIDYQTEYCKDISAPTDYDIDWDVQCDNFKHWEHHKEEDVATYRDHSHPSPVTGSQAPLHHTKWWDAMDDTLETFMDTK